MEPKPKPISVSEWNERLDRACAYSETEECREFEETLKEESEEDED